MSKKDYSVESLKHNWSFRRLVEGRASDKEIGQWNKWIAENEKNREKAKKAMAEIAGFEFSDPAMPDIDSEWDRLYSLMTNETKTESKKKSNKQSSLTWVYRIAAVLILGSILGVGVYFYQTEGTLPQVEQITQKETITTDSGEQKTIKFSNGSKIVISSNSAVTYAGGGGESQTINVVLQGEAYFDANKSLTTTEPMFEIETPDGSIRDIGTKFLVSVEEDRSSVVLQDGTVEVNTKNGISENETISIEKGERLEFDKSTVLFREMVNPTFYTSWATGYLEFNKTSIEELAGFLEQRFSIEVQVANAELSELSLDGAVYYKSLAELVRSVSEVTKIPVYQSKDKNIVYIGYKNERLSLNNNNEKYFSMLNS